ncbi:hypothetical protein [Vibrio vulnificus YJ016]|uniref:Uncharacterized protein n=1 Tax=Vibrio vulnificus (strain YJ016) TaxID=196600 RepID=Q7MJ15_VIBVY|nr:hypothetical protein [Vibrio vulnificus YJ016]
MISNRKVDQRQPFLRIQDKKIPIYTTKNFNTKLAVSILSII